MKNYIILKKGEKVKANRAMQLFWIWRVLLQVK